MVDLEKCLRVLAEPHSSIKIVFEPSTVRLLATDYDGCENEIQQADTLQIAVSAALVKAHGEAAHSVSHATEALRRDERRLQAICDLLGRDSGISLAPSDLCLACGGGIDWVQQRGGVQSAEHRAPVCDSWRTGDGAERRRKGS